MVPIDKMTRGERNNNPLNIKYNKNNAWLGKVNDLDKKDKVFEEFKSTIWGLRAAIKLIWSYIARENGSTVKTIVRRWAPRSDNNPTDKYIAYVEKRMRQLLVDEWKYTLEFDPNRRFSQDNYEVIHALVIAMSEFESKYTPANFEFREAWSKAKEKVSKNRK